MSSGEQEWQLLRGLGDLVVERDSLAFGPVDVHRAREHAGLMRQEADECLAALVAQGLVELERGSTSVIVAGKLTDHGFDFYARSSGLGHPAPQIVPWRPSSQERRPA